MNEMKLEFPFFCPRCGRRVEKVSIGDESVEIFCENCETISISKQEFIERLEFAIPRLKEVHKKEISAIENLIALLKNK